MRMNPPPHRYIGFGFTMWMLLALSMCPRSSRANNTNRGTDDNNNNETTTTNNISNNEIEQVECSDDQKVFVAATEFILEGRNELFDGVERTALQAAFIEIYNLLTSDICDSYFRKIQDMEFVAMTNYLNETITFEDTELLSVLDGGPPEGGPPSPPEEPPEAPPDELLSFLENATNEILGNLTPCELLDEVLPEDRPEGLPPLPEDGLPCEIIDDALPDGPPPVPNNGPPPLPSPPSLPGGGPPRPPGPFGRRKMRRRLEEEHDTTSSSANSTAGVAITYEVTGSCRDCPVSNTGSFELFDDAFRRLRIRFRVLEVRSMEEERSLQGPPRPPPVVPPPPPILPPPPGGEDGGPPDDFPPNDGPPEGGPPALASENKDDCTCTAGLDPIFPQAPTIEDLLEVLNEKLVELQEEKGILENLVFKDLLQLDDYQSLVTNVNDNANAAVLAEESTKTTKSGILDLMEAMTKEYPKGKSASSSSSSSSMEKKLDYTTFATSAAMVRSLQVPIFLLVLTFLS